METHQQCLVLVFKDATEAQDNGKFIILPEVFLREHPNIEELLRTNHICVLNEGNVSRLFVDKQRLRVFEIDLQGNPEATDFPLFVMGSSHLAPVINDLFSSFAVVHKMQFSLDSNARPAVDDTNLSVVKLLLANSEALADIQWSESTDISGSLLQLAIYRRHVALVRALLEHGLDVNGGGDIFTHFRPLDLAIRERSRDMVQLLIDHGANIDPDMWGTPLHRCHDYGTSEVLIQNGLDVNSMTKFGARPIHIAMQRTDHGALKALLNYGARWDVRTTCNESILEMIFLTHYLCSEALKRFNKTYRYLIERCFTRLDTLKGSLDLTDRLSGTKGQPDLDFRRPIDMQNRLDILSSHVFKIAALEDRLSDDLCRHLAELATPNSNLDEFVSKCKEEVARMASQKLADTQVSFTELLAKNELQVARLLKNESVAQIVDSKEFLQFPLYENILRLHLEKGKLRKFIQEEGIKSLNALSSHFRKLPDELKDKIVSFLGLLEATWLKKASVRRQTPVL